MSKANNKNLSFEEAYARLEEILENMNSGTTTLKASLDLYEEANRLIALCDAELNQTEKRVEMLIKNNTQDLCLDENKQPQTEIFETQNLGC